MKLGLIITAYNRPQYLKQCLESVSAADLSQVGTVMVIDDASTDPETRRLIDDFYLPGVELIKAYSKENRSIKGSLLFGLDILFNTCDVVTNLDGDAIVRKDFINVLLNLHETFPDHLKTGFNCLTKNRNGSERHKVLTQGVGYNTKASVGGINIMFSKDKYFEWVRPALEICIKQGGNWDHKSCLNSGADGFDIVCSVPSVVDHIGFDSSMGHSAGGEPPDVATDFLSDEEEGAIFDKVIYSLPEEGSNEKIIWPEKKVQLKNVTLICADGFNVERCIHAANISCKDIEFGAVKILSHLPSDDLRVIKIRPLFSKQDYSIFVMKEIVDYVDTPYFLTIQGDGYVLRAEAWQEGWLNFDYIGSPWIWHTDGMQVGNGAMSLRTRRLHQILKEDESVVPTNDHWIKECQEDHNICRIYRPYLESKYGIKFAPVEVAEGFGIEAFGHPTKKYNGQFGFHGKNIDFTGANISHIPY